MAKKRATGAAGKPDMIRWLFESSGDLMHVVADGGYFRLVNPAWSQLTGVPE
uniref:PAS domain-containing protein n=1 Tax=Phenylobacterium sp. TaxID=1871053 RepID=UPI00341CFACF